MYSRAINDFRPRWGSDVGSHHFDLRALDQNVCSPGFDFVVGAVDEGRSIFQEEIFGLAHFLLLLCSVAEDLGNCKTSLVWPNSGKVALYWITL